MKKWNRIAILSGAAMLFAEPGKTWSLNNGLALTPPMGWNSYNKFKGDVTQAQVLSVAKAFVDKKLKEAGYQYIVIDYCWADANRDASGNMVARKARFPSGMKTISDSIHALGLKFGMYASPNTTTCCGSEAGSYQHETTDASNFATWGVDYLKYDWCGVQSGEDKLTISVPDIIKRYVTMRDAIKATKRPIVFAMCEKGQKSKIQPATWSDTVGHMWRIRGDIAATWDRIMQQVDTDLELAKYSGPTKGWNDPDMLEVGNGSLSETENRSHFSMWCILAAPLMMGNDPSTMTNAVKDILTNHDAIAINQDSLGQQATRVQNSSGLEVWIRPLKNGDRAVVFLNRNVSGTGTAAIKWTDAQIGWTATTKVNIRDIWAAKDNTNVTDGYTAQVPAHGAVMLRLTNGLPTGMLDGFGKNFEKMPRAQIQKIRGGLSLFIPVGSNTNWVDLVDIHGAHLQSQRVKSGWNGIVSNKNLPKVFFVRLYTQAGMGTTLFVNNP
jgi:alpha-galactosidase